jgi:hypothetical protein
MTTTQTETPEAVSQFDPGVVASWVGRSVKRTDSDEGDVLGPAVVLAVDDTNYAPSAWIKYGGNSRHPSYRSQDLSDLEDIETGAGGPRWGTGGPEADDAQWFAEAKAREAGRHEET